MNLTRSKERVKSLGEVFTPPALVNEMLDKLSPDCWLPEKTFLEPSCGNGNFCVAILDRKVAAGHDPLQALSTIYGIDIMQDNVEECRERLVVDAVNAGASRPQAEALAVRNIICGDALSMDFSGEWPPRHRSHRPVKPAAVVKKDEVSPAPRVLPTAKSTYSPLEGLLIVADEHMPGVTINAKGSYTALSWRGKNVCFSFNGRKSVVVFKISHENLHRIFQGCDLHFVTVRDGKHEWPAVEFTDEEHLAQYSDQVRSCFATIASSK